MKYVRQVNDLLSELDKFGGYFIDFITTRHIQAGILRLHGNDTDTQQPHPVDEVYFVIQGKGMILINGQNYSIKEGTFIFIPAYTEHRFHSNSEDLVVFYSLGSNDTQI
jgi:mannose-6-phosphate isomerase-like protein (cupin superfamily)